MPGGRRRWKTLVSQLRELRLDVEFPTVADRPWKSPKARFPHSHSADDDSPFLSPAQTARPCGARLSDFISLGRQAPPESPRHAARPGKRRIADPQQVGLI